jgi:hypothetical protein
MLFAIFARFRDNSAPQRDALAGAFTAHLMQDHPQIKLGGPAREAHGRAAGFFLLVDAQDAAALENFLRQDPYTDLYDRLTTVRIDLEIGRI